MTWLIVVWTVFLILFNIGLYYAYVHFVPDAWKVWLRGKKMMALGVITFVAPIALDLLSQVQALGLTNLVPGPYQTIVTQVIGGLIVVFRLLQTNRGV